MAEIIDARASGGAILLLGDALTLPISSAVSTSAKPLGSIRFNPDLQEIEVYRLADASYAWKTLDRFELDTAGFYPASGGPMNGGISFGNSGNLYATYGTALEPAISFASNTNTGISGTNLGNIQFSAKGSLTFKASQSAVEFTTSLQAPAATITTVTTTTLNATSVNTFVPREISFSYIGGFTPLKVIYRFIVARRLLVPQYWAGSIATLGTPASSTARFQIRRVRSNISDTIGTITFEADSTIGTFSASDSFTLHGADRLEIVAPPISNDDYSDISVTLAMATPLSADLSPIDITFAPSNVLTGNFWPQGSVVGMVSTIDTDSTNFNYALLDTAKQQFQIVGNIIQVGSAPFKGGQFSVQATDDDGLTITKNFSVTVPPRAGTGAATAGPYISGAFSFTTVSASIVREINPFPSTSSGKVSIVGAAEDSLGLSIITAAMGPIVKLSPFTTTSTFLLGLYDHSSFIGEFVNTIAGDAPAGLTAASVINAIVASGSGFVTVGSDANSNIENFEPSSLSNTFIVSPANNSMLAVVSTSTSASVVSKASASNTIGAFSQSIMFDALAHLSASSVLAPISASGTGFVNAKANSSATISNFAASGTATNTASLTPVTMFDASPALNADDSNALTAFRVISNVTAANLSQMRVTLQTGSTGSLSLKQASIAKWDSSSPSESGSQLANTLASPIRLTYGAHFGALASAPGFLASDWLDVTSLNLAPGDKVVVSYDTKDTGSQKYNNSSTNARTFYKPGSAESADVSDMAGLGFTSLPTINYAVAKIETRNGLDYTTAVDIPLTFNDPMFTGMTELTATVGLTSGQTLSHTSIIEQSGGSTIFAPGANTISYCRVSSRECVRITDGVLNIDHCYFEAFGIDDDHADVLQAYSPGTRGAAVTIKNSYIRAGTVAATAGMFVADNWGGSITFEDVVVHGGPFGVRLMADGAGADLTISFKNVYFVVPFGAAPFSFENYGGGVHTITQWVNVRAASIMDDKLIIGDLIPQPL
jgi:hypothetical protein